MSFAFNFQLDPEDGVEVEQEVQMNGTSTVQNNNYDFTTTDVVTTPCQQFLLTDALLHSVEVEPIQLGDYTVYKRVLGDIRVQLASEDDLITSNPTFNWLGCTDLIKYEYEGGFKTWESAVDLSNYIASMDSHLFQNSSVIELGCGSGLPGLTFLKKFSPACIHFSDFNCEVLRLLTVPNVLATCFNDQNEETFEIDQNHLQLCDTNCKFWFGDWKQLPQQVGVNNKFQVVLTTETVYRTDLIPKLVDTLVDIMQYPDGVCLLAAKNIYFGVGGGTIPFKAYLDQPNCPLYYNEVFNLTEGVNRQVLEIRWKL